MSQSRRRLDVVGRFLQHQLVDIRFDVAEQMALDGDVADARLELGPLLGRCVQEAAGASRHFGFQSIAQGRVPWKCVLFVDAQADLFVENLSDPERSVRMTVFLKH